MVSNTVHIVCPDCDAVNRIPGERLSDRPKCGKCHKPLFSSAPVELTARNFKSHLGHNDIPVLVDFWAPWCGPCKMMTPAFQRAAAELEPEMRLAKLNTEAEQSIATEYGIRNIPTMVLFRNGQEVARQAGAMGGSDIVRWARAH